jgi:spermidine/putrescine transport system permease protein
LTNASQAAALQASPTGRALPLALMAPALAIIAFYVIVPLVCLGAYSFWTMLPDGTVVRDFSLETWQSLITDPFYGSVLLDTFRLAFVSTVICVIVGYGPAYLMASAAAKWRAC